MRIRQFAELLRAFRVRDLSSLSELKQEKVSVLIQVGADVAEDGSLPAMVAFDEARQTLPRDIGDELCFRIGIEILLRAEESPRILAPTALAVASIAMVRGMHLSINLAEPVSAQVREAAELTRFFWQEDRTWRACEALLRHRILQHLHDLVFYEFREGFKPQDRETLARLGDHRIQDAFFRLQSHNKPLLRSIIGSMGKRLFRLAVYLKQDRLPDNALPFLLSHLERSAGGTGKATDGLTALQSELRERLRTFLGKSTDRIWFP